MIEENRADQLEKIILSLNQLLSYDYVDLGSSSRSIGEEFEVALGLRKRIVRPASMPPPSFESTDSSISNFPAFSRSKPKESWSIALTDEFVKDTKAIDRKLQGRVLEALLDLVKAPMDPRGNSCKPLAGNLAGLWRLRIGDTRLVYKPDVSARTVYCLAFTSRGDAYR